MKPKLVRLSFWLAACSVPLHAQSRPLQFNVIYDCSPSPQKIKVLSCAGESGEALCDVQSYVGSQPGLRGKSDRKSVVELLKACHAPKPAGASVDKVKKGDSGSPSKNSGDDRSAAKGGQPPKPGLTSCAGKIEGRYTSSGFSNLTIVFHAGKATLKAPLLDNEETECWMGGGKIYLHKPGESKDIPIDINDDGTLTTPFGEIKRKGSS